MRVSVIQPLRNRAAFAGMLLAALIGAWGCDGKKGSSKGSAGASGDTVTALDVQAPRALPQYSFAEGLRGLHPEVAAFLVQFLETCLANDYDGYREMVSHRFRPEPRDRFEAIYSAIQSVAVETIEQIDSDRVGALPSPVYRVVSDIKLDPEQSVAMRGPNRKVAILVFREQGDWRIVTAPPQFQPKAAPTTQPTSSAPAPTTQPSYPWDQTGDD